MSDVGGLFEEIVSLPDGEARRRYQDLVGLDHVKDTLIREAEILIRPKLLEEWSNKHHGQPIRATEVFRDRSPLFVFAGDVGTGKTQLAETFGDKVARDLGIELLLMPLSLRARGTGAVGEMTQLISSAFAYVEETIPIPADGADPRRGAVLLVDEADALAQSRELEQMHHEDRAGVNALIRGVSAIASQRRPIITVMCSNRPGAIDPAVRRRAADIFTFQRPSPEQRGALLRREFGDLGFSEEQLAELVELTGKNGSREHGFTYSDLTTRLVPKAVLDVMPDRPLAFERVRAVAEELEPTAPFVAMDV